MSGADAPMLLVDAFGEFASGRQGFSPGLRAALSYASVKDTQGDVRIGQSVLTLRLEPSLLKVRAGPVVGTLFVSVEGGAAVTEASGAARGTRTVRPWLRAGAGLRGAVHVAGPVAIEVDASVLVAAVRDEFVVEPVGLTYRTPVAAPVGKVGIVLELP